MASRKKPDQPVIHSPLTQKLIARQQELGFTNKQFSEHLGVQVDFFSRILQGTKGYGPASLAAIGRAYPELAEDVQNEFFAKAKARKEDRPEPVDDPDLLMQLSFDYPPGTNNVYGFTAKGGKARSYMREVGVDFKQTACLKIKEFFPDFKIPPRTPMSMHLKFYCTSDTLNTTDLDGHLKVLIDEIFRCGGGNDAWIRELHVTKEPGVRDEVTAVLRILRKE